MTTKSMSPLQKILICLFCNVLILVFVIALVSFLASPSPYWRFGPSDTLILISVRIDSWNKYMGLLLIIGLIEASRVLVEELGMPVLGFNIYNPDKKKINDFTKNQLQVLANAMFLTSALRGVFITMITVTQIDIAVWLVFIGQISSIYTIRILLNEKEFPENIYTNECEESVQLTIITP